MMSATMTSTGQITLPTAVQEDLGLAPGDEVLFVKISEGHYRLVPRTGSVSDLAGMLHRPGQRALSLQETDHGMAAAAAASSDARC